MPSIHSMKIRRSIVSNSPWRSWVLVALLTILGCRQSPEAWEETSEPGSRLTGTQAPHLLVVDNPTLAAAIEREWQARSGETLPVATMTHSEWQEIVDGNRFRDIAADAVIYPCEDLGALAEAHAILPAPSYIDGPDSALAAADILPLIRQVEIRWGGTLCAVPFSSAPLLLVFRADILEQMGAEPPRTWQELHDLAERLAVQQDQQALPGRIESVLYQPLAEGWAARLLIARGAAYVRDAAKYSDLWEVITMEPLIAGPPFVRALRELAADQVLAQPTKRQLNPEQVFDAIRSGKCVLAVGCWPSGWPEPRDDFTGQLGFSLLPGAAEYFERTEATEQGGTWVRRQSVQQVPVLAAGGYVGSVVRGTRRQRAAWNLLVQLADPDWGTSVCAAGRQAAPFRASHLQQIQVWLAGTYDDQAAAQFRTAVSTYFASELSLPMLRIPGASGFLQELDEAVQAVTGGTLDAPTALAQVASAWTVRLNKIGRDALSTAYLHQLGIEPW